MTRRRLRDDDATMVGNGDREVRERASGVRVVAEVLALQHESSILRHC